jgi:hypothetical protein
MTALCLKDLSFHSLNVILNNKPVSLVLIAFYTVLRSFLNNKIHFSGIKKGYVTTPLTKKKILLTVYPPLNLK